jgi:hypothetical protein
MGLVPFGGKTFLRRNFVMLKSISSEKIKSICRSTIVSLRNVCKRKCYVVSNSSSIKQLTLLALVLGVIISTLAIQTARGQSSPNPPNDAFQADDFPESRLGLTGTVTRLTPDPLTMTKAVSSSCEALKVVAGSTVGETRLPVDIQVSRNPLFKPADDAQAPCLLNVTVGQKPLPDMGAVDFGNADPGMLTGVHSDANVYLIGPPPFALVVESVNDGGGASDDGGTQLSLYVVRNGVLLNVLVADSLDAVDASVMGSTLLLKGVTRWHNSDPDHASIVPENMSFDIDTANGRVHWHAKTPREVETVLYWLQEADPGYRAKEAAQRQAEATASEIQSRQPASECEQFLKAYQVNDNDTVSNGYHEVHQFISNWDNARISRGCAPVHGYALDGSTDEINNTVNFILRICSGNPMMNLQDIAQAIYSLNQATDSTGYGSPGALPCP